MLQKLVMKMETKIEHLSPSGNVRPFCCENCGRQFSTSAYLSQHRRIHSGIKPYVCRFCDRKFTQLSHVQQHERIHTGEKPYSCITCMKSFTQMSNLHSHQRQHMKNKPYKCSHCFMAFDLQHDLETHIESKHTSEKYHKVLVCPICSKMYHSETYLTKHVERHDESSSKSTNSSSKNNLHCDAVTKYQRHSAKNGHIHPGQSMMSIAVSQPSGNNQINESMVARSVNDMSVALDISKSIVTAASGLRLDVILESLASSNCTSPLVSAAASVWGHPWFPSPTNHIHDNNHLIRSEHNLNRSMCMDLLSINRDIISSTSNCSSSITLPTLSQITDRFITNNYTDPSKAPHINTLTTAFQS